MVKRQPSKLGYIGSSPVDGVFFFILMYSKRYKDKSLLLQIAYKMGIGYSAPAGLSYLWNFGSLALLSLIIQIITGIFLAMFYTGHVTLAFDSVEYIMRDVDFGWFVRYVHANGASLFFAVVYAHIFRGLFFGSYIAPRNKLWVSGVIILFVMIGTAFMDTSFLGVK